MLQLASECDALIDVAVRRPYGWAWDTVVLSAPGDRRPPRHVSLEPLCTPAAGLILLWSGQLLGEDKYRAAAMETVRCIAAAQTDSGKIPLHAIFGPGAAGRDEPAPIAERAATRAGMALMLMVIEAETKKPEAITRSEQRAAQWLMKQQASDGGWHTIYSSKEESDNLLRIIRLDNSDWRDTTFVLLHGAGVMDDRLMARSAALSVQKLIGLRLGDQPSQGNAARPGTGLDPAVARRLLSVWSTAYRPTGAIDEKLKAFPAAADAVATRYAMQTLLGSYLMTEDKATGVALDAAAEAMEALRDPRGLWPPLLLAHAPTAPQTQPTSTFFNPAAGPPPAGAFGLPATLNAVKQLKTVGRSRYERMLSQGLTPRQHLAATVCGLLEDPFTLDFPVSSTEVANYLKAREEDWKKLDEEIPGDVPSRVRRLWTLYLRARLEKMAS